MILHPDPELLLCRALREHDLAEFVGLVPPDPLPSTAITVRMDGGPRLDVLRQSTAVGVNVYARTDEEASLLARQVSAILGALADQSVEVLRVEHVSGWARVPDPAPVARRYAAFNVTTRGEEWNP